MDDAARERLAAPVRYADTWAVLGAVLVALAIAWALGLVVASLRRRRARRAEATMHVAATQAAFGARVDEVERLVDTATLTPAAAALELAAIARAWVAATTDLPAGDLDAATAAELAERGHGDLASVVGTSYPPAFDPRERSVQALMAEVRRLIAQ